MASARFKATSPDPEAARADRTVRVDDDEQPKQVQRKGMKDRMMAYLEEHPDATYDEVGKAIDASADYVRMTAKRSGLTLAGTKDKQTSLIRVPAKMLQSLKPLERKTGMSSAEMAKAMLEAAYKHGLHKQLFG
jgi:hypothetical protein